MPRRVPIPVIGPAYENRSLDVSAQVTKNLYPEVNPEGKAVVSLHAFPGLKEFSDLSTVDHASGRLHGQHPDRGFHVMNGVLHVVNGDHLFEVGPTGNATSLTGITRAISGTARVDMADNGEILLIANGAALSLYDPSITVGETVNTVTDADVVGPRTITYLNKQFVFDDAEGSEFKVSQVGTTLSTTDFADTADRASAEAYPDSILRAISYNQLIYFFGMESLEPYYNSGIGNPPFDRVQSGVRPTGVSGPWCIAQDDDVIFFLSDDRMPMLLRGLEPIPIGTPALGKEFAGYSDVSDAIAMVFTLDHQRFFQLTFPTADRTWVYHEPSNSWFQLSSGVDKERHRASSYANVYGKHIFADHSNGKLYELDFDTFTDNGETVQRKRTTAVIHGGLYGSPGEELIFERVGFDFETGVGLATGQGSDPEVMIRYSDDRGRTWSALQHYQLGPVGNYLQRVELLSQGRAHERVYEISYSDPTRFTLLSGYADVSVGT